MPGTTQLAFRLALRILCGIGIVFCCLAWIEYRLAAQAQSAEAAEAALGLPFQGRLLTHSETPVTSGKWTALFSIYTTETGSNPEWSSGDMPLDVKAGGFFSTRLGEPASPILGIDSLQQLYVGVRIDYPGNGVTTANDPEMLPRIPLVPALYAHKAGDSALLAGHDRSAILVNGKNDPASTAIRGDKLAAGSVNGTKLSADVADGTTIELAEDHRLQVKDNGISIHKLFDRVVGPLERIVRSQLVEEAHSARRHTTGGARNAHGLRGQALRSAGQRHSDYRDDRAPREGWVYRCTGRLLDQGAHVRGASREHVGFRGL